MSYQLIDLKLENYQRIVSDTNPLHVSLGAISGNDTTTMKVSVVVSAVSVGATATLSLEESMDGGLSWVTVNTSVTGTINATGTWSVWLNEVSGIVAPSVRLSVTPLGVGDTLYISKAYRTFNTDGTIVPRFSAAGAGLATEATLSSIDTSVNNIEASVDNIETSVGNIDTSTNNIEASVDNIETAINDRLSGSLVPSKFDYISYTSGVTSDVYVYKTGGAGGTTVKTVTLNYTDATKGTLVDVVAS